VQSLPCETVWTRPSTDQPFRSDHSWIAAAAPGVVENWPFRLSLVGDVRALAVRRPGARLKWKLACASALASAALALMINQLIAQVCIGRAIAIIPLSGLGSLVA